MSPEPSTTTRSRLESVNVDDGLQAPPNQSDLSRRIGGVDRPAPTVRTGSLEEAAAAFAEWVEPHVPIMARLASRLAPDADRDDVVQEALIQAWRKRDQYDEERGSPRAWLLAITADRARQARRRRPRTALLGEMVARVRSTEDRLDLE